jgi:hypothetical protein
MKNPLESNVFSSRLRRCVAILAVLLPSMSIIVIAAQAPGSFEVASVKAVGPAPAGALAAFGGGCDGGFPRLDHNGFAVTTTAYVLMTWAYAFNKYGGCSFVSYGGPDFRRTLHDLHRTASRTCHT